MNIIRRTLQMSFLSLTVCFFLSTPPPNLFAQSIMEQLKALESGNPVTPSPNNETETDTNSDFKIIASMDRPDRTYLSGESFRVRIRTEKPGHLYIACESDGKKTLIYPNDYAKANLISARTEYVLPANNAAFTWRIHGKPDTKEKILIVVSERPLNMKEFDINSLPDQEKDLFSINPVEVVPNFRIGQVAIDYTIVEKRSQPPQPTPTPTMPTTRPRRIAMIFSQTHKVNPETRRVEEDRNVKFRIDNAIHITNVLKSYGRIDGNVDILRGTDFNKKKIKETFAKLARETNPGDEIFIYWESHGGTGIPDRTGREPDGKHEFLCMYDYRPNAAYTDGYILDDEFADMLAVFKDRRLMILLEACHSGGMMRSSSRSFTERELISDAEFRNACQGNVDYSDLLATRKRILDFSDVRGHVPLASEVNFSFTAPSSENAPAAGGLRQSLRSLVNNAKNDDSSEELVFVANVQSRLAQTLAKDIDPQTPNLAIIFSCSKHESSWCAAVDADGEIITLPDSTGTNRLIGAPVLALILAMTDAQGELTANKDRALFDDAWGVAKDLIPKNGARLARLAPDAGNPTQTPVYMNTIKDICIRPPSQ